MTCNLAKLQERRRGLVEAFRENDSEDGLRNLLTELYPDNAHFIYELLQNAEDAGASSVRFTLERTMLTFEHNGSRPFSIRDVESITNIAKSTKRDDPTSIGKFGVGFKAVFAYTNTPEIHSGDLHFQIRDLFVPETEGVDQNPLGQHQTRFLFPFDHPKKSPKQAVEEIGDALRALNENTLLFVSNIERIEYVLPSHESVSLHRVERESGHVELKIEKGKQSETSHWLRFYQDVQIKEHGEKGPDRRIAIAYKLDEVERSKAEGSKRSWKIVPRNPGQVCIYFPAAKEVSNLLFHIHAPFASTAARDSVRDCAENRQLLGHIAKLVVTSLYSIRNQGLLKVDFMAVLPNPQDKLDEFYEPVRLAVVNAFKEAAFTPTKSGSHSPANTLLRGPAEIQTVIGDEDMVLFGQHVQPRLWAKHPAQENQREVQFFDSLDIKHWSWCELENALDGFCNDKDDRERFECWISKKDDASLLRFYALLGQARNEYDNYSDDYANLQDVKIVRVTFDGTDRHVKPNDAFFPSGDALKNESSTIKYVKSAAYEGSRSAQQKRLAEQFLLAIKVRPYDTKAEIESVLQQYVSGMAFPQRAHIKHMKKFVEYWVSDKSSALIFKNAPFLQVESQEGKYLRAFDLYIDAPYLETGLAAFFCDSSLPISVPKQRLSSNYRTIKQFAEFAAAIGVMEGFEMVEHEATAMQKESFSKIGKLTKSTVDCDYFLNGLVWHQKSSSRYVGDFDLAKIQSISLSRVIWRAMCKAGREQLVARYKPNKQRQHESTCKASFILDILKTHRWIPDEQENFLRPTEVCAQTLHADFKLDDSNGWLAAIGFGDDAKRASDEYQIRSLEVQKDGYDSVEEKREWAKLRADTKEQKISIESVRERALGKRGEIPNESLQDADRRRKNVLEDAATAPSKESVRRERNIQQSVDKTTAKAKTYLLARYTNDSGEMICQSCEDVMPFKLLKTGNYYFEAAHCIRETETLDYQNRLALCPNCCAMYSHARETPDDQLRDRIVNCAANDDGSPVKIAVRLAGTDSALNFNYKHWFDLKIILDKLPQ